MSALRHARTLPHIQKALDRLYPGLHMRYNTRQACWVITDRLTHDNGLPDRYAYYQPTMALRGGTGDRPVNEGVIFRMASKAHLADPGTPMAPCRARILGQLRRAFTNNRKEAVYAQVDKIEAAEDQEQNKQNEQINQAQRQTAEDAWRLHTGKVTTGGGVKGEHYSDRRKTLKSIHKKMLADAAEQEQQQIEMAIKELAAEGKVCTQFAGSLWD